MHQGSLRTPHPKIFQCSVSALLWCHGPVVGMKLGRLKAYLLFCFSNADPQPAALAPPAFAHLFYLTMLC